MKRARRRAFPFFIIHPKTWKDKPYFRRGRCWPRNALCPASGGSASLGRRAQPAGSRQGGEGAACGGSPCPGTGKRQRAIR